MQQQQPKLQVHPWELVEPEFQPQDYNLNATLFALGNGFIGLRGAFEEGYEPEPFADGCYLNGVYASEPITYGESAYGYAKNNQRMLSVPNGKALQIWLDGERFSLAEGTLLDYERRLDMASGLLHRKLRWRSPQGKTLELHSRRLVSLTEKHLYALDFRLIPLDFDAEVRLVSSVDAGLAQAEKSDDPRLASPIDSSDIQLQKTLAEGDSLALIQKVHSSGFTLGTGALHRVECASDCTRRYFVDDCRVSVEYRLAAQRGKPIQLTKYVAHFASRDESAISTTQLSDYLERCSGKHFEDYAALQRRALDEFWARSDLELRGNDTLQQGMRFNLFHLFQSLGRGGRTNIAAKGLSGDGYEGHYFWDTEIYILPFFLYTQPQLARGLLEYRHSILDAARSRARELAVKKGALFPWRTIGGEECSAYYPAGTAQFHINADIAYAVRQYCSVTGDTDFLRDKGAEIVIEGARLWLEIGHYNPRRNNQFCINEVTGPDEYTALVDNNFYTNLMARAHLYYACEVYEWLQAQAPQAAAALAQRIGLDADEPAAWRRAADAMYLPQDETLGIYPQDDSFLGKPEWDFENTPADHYPLLLNYHPLVIYRHQVCKQADVILGLFLQSPEFTVEQKRRNFDYYEPRTTHDSTLSACIHSIIANEVGYHEKALSYFQQVARMDLDNLHNNTQHGIHTACMGGTWLCLVQGFAGMRLHGDTLHFNPTIPDGLQGYRFRLQFRESILELDADRESTRYTLVSGAPLKLRHAGESLLLSQPGQSLTAQQANVQEALV
ncbi:glycoside hydrolase family 65 protein [Microbulbifer thermotolerans]|uniref:Glycoside hydrolase family 65 protein n=1 Tax=Microbulbifer thermotolerans TaxID=252514 RepID=A0AB35I0F5_MICTH|nr:glycosyl hydrolase family 65 protein [Microbulbifer thermotolerans]MCX2802188.1 glycoside hydrolase family 65 protein [Microbulbifer thermotolerans]